MFNSKFGLNEVLSFNRTVNPVDYIDREAVCDEATAIALAENEVSLLALRAEEMVEAWNNLGAYAINLEVQKSDDLGFRIVGEWADCLAVEGYNQEVDVLTTANHLGRQAYKEIKTAMADLDVDFDYVAIGIHRATSSIRTAIFNNEYFKDLHNTSFFKHIGKAFDPLVIRAEFDETNEYSNLPFYPTEDEQQQEFRRILRRTFEGFLYKDNNEHIIKAVSAFELEQVALASAQAAIIIQACSLVE